MNLNLFIARRIGGKSGANGKASKRSNFIAGTSVAVSVAIMIISIAVMGGFKNEIKEKATGFVGDISLSAPGVEITNEQYPINGDLSIIPLIDSLDFVKNIQPVSYRSGLIKTQDQIQGVVFKGVDSLYDMSFFKKHLYVGELPIYGKSLSNDIMISKRLADLLGYSVEDNVLAYFIGDDVKVRKFRISGIFDAQLEELDKVLVLADIKHITRLNGWNKGEVSGFEILLTNDKRGAANLDKEEQVISDIIYEHLNDEDESITVNTVRDTYYILFDWLSLVDINVLVILFLMIAVAGVNMISGILIILFENISKIGLLKALGMRNIDISKVFLLRAASIVWKGLLCGNIFAGGVCYIQWRYKLITLDPANYFVKYIPIDIDIFTVVLVNILAFVIIMAILLIPCHFISRVSPAKTLVVK